MVLEISGWGFVRYLGKEGRWVVFDSEVRFGGDVNLELFVNRRYLEFIDWICSLRE